MGKRIEMAALLLMLPVVCSACSQNPGADGMLKELYSLEARLSEMEEDLGAAEDRLLSLEAEAKTEPVAAPVEVTTEQKPPESTPLKVGPIALGYSRDLVLTLLGNPRSVTHWEWLDGSEHEMWNYENGMTVKFFDRYVRSVRVTASGPSMDMGLCVGLLGKEAEKSLLDRGLMPFAFQDGAENVGWFESGRGELVILEYNDRGDLFNYGLLDGANERVWAYTLDSVSSYR